jgi:hypothetical protein
MIAIRESLNGMHGIRLAIVIFFIGILIAPGAFADCDQTCRSVDPHSHFDLGGTFVAGSRGLVFPANPHPGKPYSGTSCPCSCDTGYWYNLNGYYVTLGTKNPSRLCAPSVTTAPPSQPAPVSGNVSSDCSDILFVHPADLDLLYTKAQVRDELLGALKRYSASHELDADSDFPGSDSGSALDYYTGKNNYLLEYFMFTDSSLKGKDSFLPSSWFSDFYTGKEGALGDAIAIRAARDGGKLGPGAVFEESLALNNGHVFKSLLTAQNYLKAETAGVRAGHDEASRKLQDDLQEIARIENELTQNGLFSEGTVIMPDPSSPLNNKYILFDISKRDRLLADVVVQKAKIADNGIFDTRLLPLRTRHENPGVWYHLFVTTSLAYGSKTMTWSLPGGSSAQGDVWLEHRVYKGIFQLQGTNIDTGKYCWDIWGAEIGENMYDTMNPSYGSEYWGIPATAGAALEALPGVPAAFWDSTKGLLTGE